MNEELIFRVAFGIILIVSVSISGYYRARARQAAPVIPRHAEGGALIVMRIIVALPLLATLLLFILYPDWLLWSKMQLPALARWSAVAVAAATIPFTRWVFRSLGSNVSETILTKEGQQLVTWGPYRWIRHPLYSGAVLMLAALGIVAANWFMLLLVLLIVTMLWKLTTREEAHLLVKFGDSYRDYMGHTGRFIPKLGTAGWRK
jgi:protein-S-isoprenylcysteine O-methyltransferase Ste14